MAFVKTLFDALSFVYYTVYRYTMIFCSLTSNGLHARVGVGAIDRCII